MNYTADDFANAKFAEHPDGTYGARTHPYKSMWSVYDKKSQMVIFYTDEEMARFSFRPVREAAPLTLDTLRDEWENAEVPTADNPIRVGDECIMPLDDSWIVGFEGDDWMPSNGDDSRVLRRAPQPEPWVELAGVLHDEAPAGVVDVDHLAERLYGAGVRVVGGDEK